jgi:hypothetical protein
MLDRVEDDGVEDDEVEDGAELPERGCWLFIVVSTTRSNHLLRQFVPSTVSGVELEDSRVTFAT